MYFRRGQAFVCQFAQAGLPALPRKPLPCSFAFAWYSLWRQAAVNLLDVLRWAAAAVVPAVKLAAVRLHVNVALNAAVLPLVAAAMSAVAVPLVADILP